MRERVSLKEGCEVNLGDGGYILHPDCGGACMIGEIQRTVHISRMNFAVSKKLGI